ncbi:MAG: DUF4186 family protein [Chloroflexi bacterium]|nr:DUF4186 family protein [Chloroflexota bacterium]MYC01555.1 DUF4186 family protein [Chloroflexota bacterium]
MAEAEQRLPPLKVTCTSSDCDSGLHCFKATRKMVAENQVGACRSCGIELVDWGRVHHRRIEDVDHTFIALRQELVRHHFWHLEFDQKAQNHALRKGRPLLHQAARRRIESSVGKAAGAYDGRQTGWNGNTIFYAQHAVAACCRTCISYWHGIDKDHDLEADEHDYLVALVVRFLDERLPDLPEEPTRVPPIRGNPRAN